MDYCLILYNYVLSDVFQCFENTLEGTR